MCSPSYFSLLATVVCSLTVGLFEQIFLTKEDISLHNWSWNFYQLKQFQYTTRPICYNKRVKKIYARTFVTFYFSLSSSIQCLPFVGIRSYSTQGSISRRMGQMYLSIVKEYFSVLMNNTPPKSFSVDFICFKYCFWFGI